MASIDLVVVNYKTYGVLNNFLRSIRKFPPAKSGWSLMVIDNEFDELSFENLIGAYPEFGFYASEKNLGYAGAANLGASLGNSEYLAILNSDLQFVNDTCIDMCVEYLENNPDVGIVGPLQYSTAQGGRKITHAGIFGPGDKPKHRGWLSSWDGKKFTDTTECLMVSGSAMFIRRAAWNAIMEDEIFRKHWPDALGAMPEHPLYYEDTALCYAMPRFGYKVVFLGEPGSELIHQWHQTIKSTGDAGHFATSRKMFRSLMDDWGILHD